MPGAGEDALEANTGGGVREGDEFRHQQKEAHHAPPCGPDYSSAPNQDRHHLTVSGSCSDVGLSPPAKKGKRRGASSSGGPIPVGSFVDQAFSLNLPGHIRLVSVPGGSTTTTTSSSARHDDHDLDDEDEDEGDDPKAPFLTSYYPLIPLLLSLCFPVVVLYQHYSRSCLNFDPAASAATASLATSASASDPDLGDDMPAEAGAAALHVHASSSILQHFIFVNFLRLLLAIALVVCGPTLRVQIDQLLRRIRRSPAWHAMEGPLRRTFWRRNDDHFDSSPDDCLYHSSTPSSLFLGSGYNRERTASGHSLNGSRSSSSPTGHIPALKGLAALTLVMLAVHPDGCLWYLLAVLWDGIWSVGDGLLALLVMIGDGDIPILVVTGVLLSLFVLARKMQRALLPEHQSSEIANSSSGAFGGCSAGKSGKGRSKKGKKGKGRGSGRGRIRHQQSRSAHHHHQQHNDNRHENPPRHQSTHSLKSSTSSHMSVSSLEEQKIRDFPGRSRLDSSDVSDTDPSPPSSGNGNINNNGPPKVTSVQELESSGCAPTDTALGVQEAADSLGAVQIIEDKPQITGNPTSESELQPKSTKKKKLGGAKKIKAAGSSSPALITPPIPRTPRHVSTSSSGYSVSNHDKATFRYQGVKGRRTTPQLSPGAIPPTRSSTEKGQFTPPRENKGQGGYKRPKSLSVDNRNRNRNQPRSPAASAGNYTATAHPYSNEKAEQSQISFANVLEGRRTKQLEDPWRARAQDSAATERENSSLSPSSQFGKNQNDICGSTAVGKELSISSPEGSNQTLLRPPPGLAPLLDTVRSPGKGVSAHQGRILPPIGHESTPIGGNELSALGTDRTVLGIPSLQTDHTDGLFLHAPVLGTDPARTRCLSGDDMSVFSVGTSASVAILSLSPLPQSNFGVDLGGTISTGLTAGNIHVGGMVIPVGVGGGSRLVMDDDDKIEADLQELGGQMVGSVLD
mmetsp:Transcript_10737/g.30191  ORF Transcript_10737/g.30191 Transcript_10737/m.30191 type:complete len:965 (+) Transcript_10737:143-3037(+)